MVKFIALDGFLSRFRSDSASKRPRKAEGGVLSGWKRRLALSKTTPNRPVSTPALAIAPVQPAAATKDKSTAEDVEKEDDGLGGAFAEEAPAEDVADDRAAKGKATVKPVFGKRNTSQVSLATVFP